MAWWGWLLLSLGLMLLACVVTFAQTEIVLSPAIQFQGYCGTTTDSNGFTTQIICPEASARPLARPASKSGPVAGAVVLQFLVSDGKGGWKHCRECAPKELQHCYKPTPVEPPSPPMKGTP